MMQGDQGGLLGNVLEKGRAEGMKWLASHRNELKDRTQRDGGVFGCKY